MVQIFNNKMVRRALLFNKFDRVNTKPKKLVTFLMIQNFILPTVSLSLAIIFITNNLTTTSSKSFLHVCMCAMSNKKLYDISNSSSLTGEEYIKSP